MKKVLLIGNRNEITESLNECVQEKFDVHICPRKMEDVKVMVKIIKPELMLLCRVSSEEENQEIFTWICDNNPDCPILGIATEQEWHQCRTLYRCEQFHLLIRPVSKRKLLETCNQLLETDFPEMRKTKTTTSAEAKKKIMLVDDSAVMLRRIKGMLDRYYDICMAKSGEQALEMMKKETPDLVLLDYEMDGMNGKETYEVMKQDEKNKDIPVIFLTSNDKRKSIYSILQTRPDGYILKPPEEKRILETIAEVLSKES